MNNTLIYIDEQLIDLRPGTVVASTFKALEIGDLRTRNSNYTNQFKLPKSPRNKQILEHADFIKSTTRKPYTKLPAKVIQNGIEIIPRGIAFIESCDDHFNISIHSGSYGFFSLVGDRLLNELDFTSNDYGSTDNIVEIPFIASDEFDEDLDPLEFSQAGVSVPYKSVIQKIIESAGYSASGDIFNNTKLGLMYLSCLGTTGYNDQFVRPKEFDVLVVPGYSLNVGSAETKVDFTDVIKNANGWYDGLNTYKVEDPQGGAFGGAWFLLNVYATVKVNISLEGGAPGVDIELFSAAGVHQIDGAGSGTYELEISERTSGPLPGIENLEIYMRMRTTLGIGTAVVTFEYGRMYNTILREAVSLPVPYISIQGVMPDYMQKELLRHFMIAFGVFFREMGDNKLEARTLTEIITDRDNAVDWTSKRDVSKQEKILYALNNYAQVNRMRYNTGDDLVGDDEGIGTFEVDNENTENVKDFYTTDFEATATLRVGSLSEGFLDAAKIPIEPSQGDDPGMRILFIRNKRDSEPTFAGPISSYKVAYFSDPLEGNSLSWQTFIDEHYPTLVQYLNKAKVVTRHYFLTPVDIAQLDLFRLIYDSGDYFLINTVDKFVPGLVTKVELFKVS